MAGHIVGGLGLILLGIFAVVARLSRWKWFNEHYKVTRIEDALGKKNADILYVVLGFLCAIFGILIIARLIG